MIFGVASSDFDKESEIEQANLASMDEHVTHVWFL